MVTVLPDVGEALVVRLGWTLASGLGVALVAALGGAWGMAALSGTMGGAGVWLQNAS